jgi:TRAP-type C4-dicarboxylate transport system permease small subunit
VQIQIKQILGFLRKLEDALLVTLLLSMIGIATTQVLLRNFFDSGLYWGDSLVRVTVLWVALVGAMIASRNDSHIRIDLASRFLSGWVKPWVARISNLFTCIVLILFTWGSYQFVSYEFIDNAIAFGDVPAWICESIMPVGGAVMAIRYALLTVKPI